MLGTVRNDGRCREESDGTLLTVQKYRLLGIMSKSKRKLSKFSAGREARRRAREAAGPPPAERVIPDKRRKPPKHKNNPLESNDQ
jgi:hypothetical protein